MIQTLMHPYDYFTIGTKNAYGQMALPTKESQPIGSIKMAISLTQQSTQDNINYKDAKYIGLTHADIDDTYVIKYHDEMLKVLYINPDGRYK